MVEWDVLDDKPLPAEDAPAPRRPLPWRTLAIALILLLALAAGGVAIRYRVVREQLRTDIQSFVTEEERALRFGISERAAELADPDAPTEWREWYRSTFQATDDSPLPPPVVTKVEQTGDLYLVTIEYRRDGQTYTSVRNYRLMTQGWRRTPITALQWGNLQPVETPALLGFEVAARDGEVIETAQVVQTLNTFRAAWNRHWPIGATTVEVRIVPTETLAIPTIGLVPDGIIVYARSPLLSETPLFESPTACSLGLIEGIAQVYSQEYIGSNDGQRLRPALRQSLMDYLLNNEDGLCLIGEEVQVGPDYAAQLELPPNFGSYIIEHFGPQMLAAIARTSFGSDSQQSIVSATGYPYGALLYAMERDLPLQPTLTPNSVEQAVSVAQVVARDGSDPIQFQVRFSDNTTATATAAQTPFDACISLESEVAVTRNSDQSLTIARVLERHLAPRLNATPWPATTRLVYSLEDSGNTQLTARTAEGEYQALLTVEGATEFVPAPDGSGVVAYLTTDTCGWALNVYNPVAGNVERYTTMEEMPSGIFWIGNNPVVLHQKETETGPAWQAYLLGDTTLQFFASNRGRFLGHSSSRGMLVVLHESALHFATAGRNNAMLALAFRFVANSEVSALSPDGRYLAYNVYPSDGRADLKVLDLDTMTEIYLNTIPPSVANGESRWSFFRDSDPTLAVAGGDLSGQSGMTIQTYTLDPATGANVGTYRSNGEIDNLHWCQNGQLTFHLTTETGFGLVSLGREDRQAQPLSAVGEKVVWCP